MMAASGRANAVRRHPFPVHHFSHAWVFSIGSVVVFEVPPVLEVPMGGGVTGLPMLKAGRPH